MKKKKIAGMILAKMAPPTPKEDEPSKEEFFRLAKRDAATRMLKAIKDEDHAMLVHAMSDFFKVCSEYEEEEG